MREHHQQHLPLFLPPTNAAAPSTIVNNKNRRRPCELFVPRVKESRLCTICGFTLIDHDVEPVHYHIPTTTASSTATPILQNNSNNSGLQHSKSAETSNKNNNYLIEDEYQSFSTSNLLIPTCLIHSSSSISSSPIYMTAHNSFRSLDTHLTPSFNSAFSEYKRSPSRDSIAISDISASPISFKSPSFSHYDTVSTQHHHHQHQQNIIVAPNTSSSLSKIDIRHPPTIIKPKPLPMPRPYLKQGQLSLAPTMEDEHEDDESEIPQRSPAMFKRIRHKRKDRSASAHTAERNSANLSSLSLNQMDQQSNIRHSVAVPPPPTNQEAVVRPQNFKEILNRFQTATEGNNPTAATTTTFQPPPFQRHHSVRLPSAAQQNRRFTLGGEALHIDTKTFSTLSGLNKNHPTSSSSNSPMTTATHHNHGQLQPPPIVKLRASTVPINYHQHQNQTMSPYSDIDNSLEPKTILQIPLREKSNLQRRDSDAYQAAIKARRTGLIGSFIEGASAKENNNQQSSDEDDDFQQQHQQQHLRRQYHQHQNQSQPRRSSPDEDININKFRTSKVNTPTVTVTTQEVSTVPPPPIKKRQSKMSKTATIPIDGQFQAKEAVLTVAKPKPPNRSNTMSAAANEIHRKLSTHSNHSNASSIKNSNENSNEKNKNQSSILQSNNESRVPTAEYLSGGSDSGYPRGRWSHSAETSSLESPRSPSQLLRSPNPHRIKAAEDLYTQMTVQHTTTLAFLVDNFSDIARLHGEFSEFGRDLFDEVSVDTLVFKSSSPLMTKEKLALFDAIFVAPNYAEHKVTVMLAPTCQYAPLMGRNAERSGFGPQVLAEIEEPELSLRNLLDQAGIEPSQRSSIYRLVIMPPLSLCSFHSLAAHNMHKAMNVQRYEHHVCFIMLQLLCALKVLQSDGVEHLSNNFKEFLLTYRAIDLKTSLEDLHHLPKLLLLRETMEEEYDDFNAPLSSTADIQRVGVCRYALRALCTLLNHKMNNIVPPILERTEFSRSLRRCAELLHMDKSSSLTEAKNLLEFTFFCGRVTFESELDAKLWLDERRAHEVNRVVRLLADKAESLSEPRERMYVQFLLSVTPRTLFQTYRQFNQC